MPPYDDSDYSDSEGGSPAEAPMPDGQEEAKGGEEQTTTIPKSLCPGMKVGDEVVLKIEQETDSEFVVKYAPKKESKGGMAERDPELAGMLEE